MLANNNNNNYQDNDSTRIILDDLSSPRNSFYSLKSKLSIRKLYHPKPCSTSFEMKNSIKSGFYLPYDVKISHLNDCMIVSDSENESLKILDLESGQLKCSIKIGQVTRYLAIEMDKRKEKEYLYLSVEDGFLYKFDLAKLISDGLAGLPLSYVWKLGESNDVEEWFDLPSCIAVSYSNRYKNENTQEENAIILVCDTSKNKILMLASSDGSLVDSMETYVPDHLVENDEDYANVELHNSFRRPFGICLDNNEDIIISEHHSEMMPNIFFLKKVGDCLVSVKSLKKSFPTYVMFDPVKQYLFISEEGVSGITIIDSEGNTVKKTKIFKDFEKEESFDVPDGMCINDKTGELFLVDCDKNQILIFK